MRVAIAGARTSCPIAARPRSRQRPPALHTGTLFRLTHSSPNAVTSSCVPESSLLEAARQRAAATGYRAERAIRCVASPMIQPAGRRPQLTLTVPSESASPAGPGGVGHPAPILPAQATTAAHEPVIIFGTYLASPAAHAHSAPHATGCDTISPRPRTRWSGAISGGVARSWIRTGAS